MKVPYLGKKDVICFKHIILERMYLFGRWTPICRVVRRTQHEFDELRNAAIIATNRAEEMKSQRDIAMLQVREYRKEIASLESLRQEVAQIKTRASEMKTQRDISERRLRNANADMLQWKQLADESLQLKRLQSLQQYLRSTGNLDLLDTWLLDTWLIEHDDLVIDAHKDSAAESAPE